MTYLQNLWESKYGKLSIENNRYRVRDHNPINS